MVKTGNDFQEALDKRSKGILELSRDAFADHQFRTYQIPPALAIAKSIANQEGKQFAVVFSRQAGKDELLAQLLAWVLITHAKSGGSAVIAAPTMRPQAAISRDRLVQRLRHAMPGCVVTRDGYIVELGLASARFLSADPDANARGQTADLLLVANEAQHIDPDVWDPVFDPMAVSTNATTLFMGTPWNKESLLARQMRHIAEVQKQEGDQRLWVVPWREVAKDFRQYENRVKARIAQFGAKHPFIRTEYELEELDGEESFFTPDKIRMMQGEHPRRKEPEPGKRYAMLLDVAGEEEHGSSAEAFASSQRRDSTALTVVEVDTSRGGKLLPIYRVVDRKDWVGKKHVELHDELIHLARVVWQPERIVIDATGVGSGLASFLSDTLGDPSQGRAIPVERYIFTTKSKSELGWSFRGLIESGRYKEYLDGDEVSTRDRNVTQRFLAELKGIAFEIADGPERRLSWGASPGRGHDDLVVSAAFAAHLDTYNWNPRIAKGSDQWNW